MRIVDLSVPTGPGPGEPLPPTIDYDDHAKTAPLIAQIFGCEVGDLPDGQGWASETVTLITHAGTHVDAPWHYFPTSGGERARTTPVTASAWPGHATEGSSAAILRIEARACSVS